MTPREFFCAWIGYSDAETDKLKALRDLIYGAARFNAGATAMSDDQSKAIARFKFDWEGENRGEDMSREEINNILAGMG